MVIRKKLPNTQYCNRESNIRKTCDDFMMRDVSKILLRQQNCSKLFGNYILTRDSGCISDNIAKPTPNIGAMANAELRKPAI